MNKTAVKILIGCAITSFLALSASLFTYTWFSGISGEANQIDGKVGLRGYFHAGNGTSENPYEITTPTHLYNLSRLQNLGIFDDTFEFRIGHKQGNRYQCLDGTKWVDYLDMRSFCDVEHGGQYIMPIGGEGTPFYSHINGNGIPIVGLKVAGNPEDIGVFGYVSHQGKVENMIYKDLEVRSLGYIPNPEDEQDPNFPIYSLYSRDIDWIFNSANFNEAAVKYVHPGSRDETTDPLYIEPGEIPLKIRQGKVFNRVNRTNNLVLQNGDPTKRMLGYFTMVAPSDTRFTYGWRTSSGIIQKEKVGDEERLYVDFTSLANSDFSSGLYKKADSRISLIASTTIEGIRYSRVIQSYDCLFYSNASTWNQGNFSMEIYCDFMKQNPETAGDKPTNYKHGNNIGLIAGHVDGAMEHCFVYNGTLGFNKKSGNTPIETESQIGLVGEIGVNVHNTLDPSGNDGDTGLMNFSGIYKLIRRDFEPGSDTTKVGRQQALVASLRKSGQVVTGVNYSYSSKDYSYISYDACKNSESFSRYEPYLRHDYDGPGQAVRYITGAGSLEANDNYTILEGYAKETLDSVDFACNNLIRDEKDIGMDRGLGVFKIATAYKEAYDYIESKTSDDRYSVGCFLDGIGDTKIINGNPKNKVYFSTAEAKWTSPHGGWTNSITPFRTTTIPTYCPVSSFEYPFSRDFNYNFELELSASHPVGKYYMYDSSGFLQNYLKSVLVDQDGIPLEATDERFGFRICDNLGQHVSDLSAFMPVDDPTDNGFAEYTDADGTKQYPANSIVFRIENQNGANVSVIGCDANISIYRNWKNVPVAERPTPSTPDLQELYTMRSKNLNSTDEYRYYPTTFGGAPAGSNIDHFVDKTLTDAGALYGHIFKLDQGDYVIGASHNAGGGVAKIYYLCVQGQTLGELGRPVNATLGQGLNDVDFLLNDPLPGFPPAVDPESSSSLTSASQEEASSSPEAESSGSGEPPASSSSGPDYGKQTSDGVILVKADLAFQATFDTNSGDLTVVPYLSTFNLTYGSGYTYAIKAVIKKASPVYYVNGVQQNATPYTWTRL